nr:PilZ domain-containing protein [Methylomarinum sp. Ch1-1]MDP4519643.1 PilZ domain-containing protein [Methylomarinum sp. Ch1-1]
MLKTSEFSVQLIDISSKGALVACPQKLAINKKVTLRLSFNDGKEFVIAASVIHARNAPEKQYGLKFSRYNNELGEHLLSSQSDLIFK